MPVGPGPDPRPFDRMVARRAAQPTVDPDVEATVRLVVDNPAPAEPEPVGAPVPGAMAVLALTAFLVSAALGTARAMGVPVPFVWVFSPIWGSALLVAGVALASALPAAVSDAPAWARRRGQ